VNHPRHGVVDVEDESPGALGGRHAGTGQKARHCGLAVEAERRKALAAPRVAQRHAARRSGQADEGPRRVALEHRSVQEPGAEPAAGRGAGGGPRPPAAEGMAAVRPTEWRMQVFTVASGVTVVNDAYNASPASMRAALEALVDIHAEGRRVAVLGDMKELGSLSELAHFRIGELVARMPIERLVTVGELGRHTADGARAEGMSADAVHPCATVEEAGAVLDDLLTAGDVVLVKASRSMGLERLVEGIVQPRA
jgi:UDP-N-acetylmuramoylalanine-D-glutamate ligase